MENSPSIEFRHVSPIVIKPFQRLSPAGEDKAMENISSLNLDGLDYTQTLLKIPRAPKDSQPSLGDLESLNDQFDSRSDAVESPDTKRAGRAAFPGSPDSKAYELLKQKVVELRRLVEKMKTEEIGSRIEGRLRFCIERAMSRFLDKRFGADMKKMTSKLSPSDQASRDWASPGMFRQPLSSLRSSPLAHSVPIISIDQSSEAQSKTSSRSMS